MKTNVEILHYKKGALVDRRDVHNTWVDNGRAWLANMVGFLVPSVEIPQNIARIRRFGLGIGSVSALSASFGAEFIAAYPPGFDPNATLGNTYREDNPTGPPISTLERPVRRTGSQNPYSTALGTDVWLYENVDVYYRDNQSLTVDVTVDATAGEVVYGTFTEVYISEAGLFTDDSSVNINTPYSPLVAYVHFDTIQMTIESVLHFSWTVRFG